MVYLNATAGSSFDLTGESLNPGWVCETDDYDPYTQTQNVFTPDSPDNIYEASSRAISPSPFEEDPTPQISTDEFGEVGGGCANSNVSAPNATLPPMSDTHTGTHFPPGTPAQPIDTGNIDPYITQHLSTYPFFNYFYFPESPIKNQEDTFNSLIDVLSASNQAKGDELLQGIYEDQSNIDSQTQSDYSTLFSNYSKTTPSGLAQAIREGEINLRGAIKALESSTEGIDEENKEKFIKYYNQALDKLDKGKALYDKEMAAAVSEKPNAAYPGLSDPKNETDSKKLLEQILKTQNKADNLDKKTNNLIDRLILLNGLSNQLRAKIFEQLGLLDWLELQLENGKTQRIPVPHFGHFLSDKTPDCYIYLSRILPPEIRSGYLTAMDLRLIWIYLKKGRFPENVKVTKKQKNKLIHFSDAFIPIDLYGGENATVGDLLVYRLPWKKTGAVFILRNFSRKALLAKVIKASEKKEPVLFEFDFELSLDPKTAKRRYLRPGLFALRLKPTENEVCEFKSAVSVYDINKSQPKTATQQKNSTPKNSVPNARQKGGTSGI